MKCTISSPAVLFLPLVVLAPLTLAGCGGGSNGGARFVGTTTTALTGKLATQAAIVSGYQAFQGGVNYPFVQVQATLPSGSPFKAALRAALTAAAKTRSAGRATAHDGGTPLNDLGEYGSVNISGPTATYTMYTDAAETQSAGTLTITQTAPAVSTINLGTYTTYPVAFAISANLTAGPLPMSGSGTISLLDSTGAGEIKGSFTFPFDHVAVSADLTLDDAGNIGGTATITENGQTISLTNLSGQFAGTITGQVTVEPQGDTGTATLSIADDSFNLTLNTPTGTATGSVDSSGNLVIAFPDGTSETINNPLAASPTANNPLTTTLSGTVVSGSGTAISPVSGDTVVFDGNSALSAVTNAEGVFTLTLPVSAVTGSDTLTVYDAQGDVVQTQTITSTAPVTITLPSIPNPPNVGP